MLAIGAVLALLLWLVRETKLVLLSLGRHRRDVRRSRLRRAGCSCGCCSAAARRCRRLAWRYGLANISRRGRDSIVQIVAFGLGSWLLLLLALVRNDLLRDWRASLPANAPNYS